MTEEDAALWTAGMEVAGRLRESGHDAYLVGGCVRDRLLGRRLSDVDIATSALPEEVTGVFQRTIPTGLQHGTVTVRHGGVSFEVTTFRTESGYSDARRPDEVLFVRDIREDLARRDFTVNAMAAGVDGRWIDPFGGRRDLAERRIRCVGDAGERFGEDALRMVRAIRFASVLKFRLAKSVWRAVRKQAPRLRYVAMERIGAEWDKMMAGDDPDRACMLLARSGLLVCLKEPLPDNVVVGLADKLRDSERARTRCLRDIREIDIRWSAWLAAMGASQGDAAEVCRALRFSGQRERRIAAAVAFHWRLAAKADDDREAFVAAVLEDGRQAASDWLEAQTGRQSCREWLSDLEVYAVPQLAVKGDELSRHLDKTPGPWVARMLRRLLEEVALGRLANGKEALLQASEKMAADEQP